jgi:Tfp pilus assembly protein PilX
VSRIRVHRPEANERGIALVAALLVVLLTSVLAATFIATTVGERSVSSNTHIARASLLTADAGVRTAQQQLANLAQAKIDSLVLLWPGSGPIITNPTGLFPAGSQAVTSTNPPFSATATISWSDSSLKDSAQTYNYNFTIVSTGNFGQVGARKVQSQGILRVSAERGAFTDFLMFTNIHTMSNGSAIWFTSSSSYDGRVHTNGEFRFAFKPTFQDQVTSVNNNAWYNNNGSPKELAANNNGTIDVPQFYGGFQRGAPSVTLPPDAYSQANAALGLAAGTTTAPTNAQINTACATGAGSGTPPNGIYVPNSSGNVTGGIYIQGDLDQALLSLDGSGNQVYTLKQGGTTKTITLDPTSNHTYVKIGASTTTYNGVPRGMMYTNGQITDLRGPDRVSGVPPPAIQQDNQLMIAATGDVIITRDVTYQDYTNGNNVLGVMSSTGQVRVATTAPNDMNLDAYVMASGSAGDFEVDNYGSGGPRGTFHLRGGLVEQYYGPFFTFDSSSGNLLTGYARDFHYDRRGLSPPYFPLTNRFKSDEPTARTLAWKEL